MKTIVVYGSTGLTGKTLVRKLSVNPNIKQLILPVRKQISPNPDKVSVVLVDFENPETFKDIAGDAVVCCLGTTIKKAGSLENFRKVDFNYVLRIAEAASKNKTPHFILISSIGANPASSNFYLRIKGELEVELSKLEFSAITILRPSLILGKRDEFRPLEVIFSFLAPLSPVKYKPVAVEKIAGVVESEIFNFLPGLRIIESREIISLGD